MSGNRDVMKKLFNGEWSQKWKKALIWVSGYVSFLCFALVGGYAFLKSEDEELKKTSKMVFFISLIFMALSAFMSIINNFGSMGNNWYSSALYDFYSVCTKLISIAQIITYAVFVILTFFFSGKKEEVVEEVTEENTTDAE